MFATTHRIICKAVSFAICKFYLNTTSQRKENPLTERNYNVGLPLEQKPGILSRVAIFFKNQDVSSVFLEFGYSCIL